MSEFLDWGVMNNESIPHSLDFECLECGWKYKTVDAFECVVGFTLLRRPIPNSIGGEKIGIVVVECPKCFEKFWIHLQESSVQYIKNHSTKWPISP